MRNKSSWESHKPQPLEISPGWVDFWAEESETKMSRKRTALITKLQCCLITTNYEMQALLKMWSNMFFLDITANTSWYQWTTKSLLNRLLKSFCKNRSRSFHTCPVCQDLYQRTTGSHVVTHLSLERASRLKVASGYTWQIFFLMIWRYKFSLKTHISNKWSMSMSDEYQFKSSCLYFPPTKWHQQAVIVKTSSTNKCNKQPKATNKQTKATNKRMCVANVQQLNQQKFFHVQGHTHVLRRPCCFSTWASLHNQSCEMSQIWQIYLCKNIGRLG